MSWARRSRLEPFKRLAATLKDLFDSVVRGMLDHCSNAFVEAMNGQMQQAKRAARGFRTAANFIAIAYLRLGKLTHLQASPFVPATARSAGLTRHRM
jgi:transposase